jgi:hypothetical protein
MQYMAWRAAIPKYSMAWTTPVNPQYMPWRASVHGMDVKVLQSLSMPCTANVHGMESFASLMYTSTYTSTYTRTYTATQAPLNRLV